MSSTPACKRTRHPTASNKKLLARMARWPQTPSSNTSMFDVQMLRFNLDTKGKESTSSSQNVSKHHCPRCLLDVMEKVHGNPDADKSAIDFFSQHSSFNALELCWNLSCTVTSTCPITHVPTENCYFDKNKLGKKNRTKLRKSIELSL